MIRKQYMEWVPKQDRQYFHNFMDTTLSNDELVSRLKQYKATMGRTKRHHAFNIKWHCAKQYSLFVLAWS